MVGCVVVWLKLTLVSMCRASGRGLGDFGMELAVLKV